MKTPYEFGNDDKRIVYVKAVDVADLPMDVQSEAGDLEQIYSVHTADGQRVALVADRNMAFVLARQNDFDPVTVH